MSAINLRQTLRAGTSIGTFVSINAPSVIEILAHAGFGTVCIDTEHGSIGPADVAELIRAADAHSVHSIVRVAEVGIGISQVLDAGASAVMVPRVETGLQAADAVAYAKYPPHGARGYGPGRASGYGRNLKVYAEVANNRVAVIVQIETRQGVANAEQILATPGIDMVFIGPADLALSHGTEPGSPEHRALIESIIETARRLGVPVGIYAADGMAVEAAKEQGATFFLLGADVMFLSSSAAQALDGIPPFTTDRASTAETTDSLADFIGAS